MCCWRTRLGVNGAMTARRLTALLITVVVVAALWGQFVINGAKPGLEPWGWRLWGLMRFFTILTNALVAVQMGQVALRGRAPADLEAAACLNIAMVGIIYHTLLVPETPFTGADWFTDFTFHTAVPVLVPLWFLAFGQKDLRLSHLPLWLIWPLVYCIFAMIRGAVTGVYPYFFVDVGHYGLARILLNITGLVLVFALAALVLWALARALHRRSA